MRDETVGTDIRTYGIETFESASDNSLIGHMITLRNNWAPLFNILTWIAVKATGAMAGMLFCIQAASVIPVYLAYRKCGLANSALCMLAYCFLVFPFTFNALKQGIAISFVMLAASYALNRSFHKSVLFIICAVGFHLTAIVGFCLYPLIHYFNKRGIKSSDTLISAQFVFVIFLGMIVVLGLGEYVVRFFAPLRGSYAYQVNHIGEGSMNLAALVILGCIAVWCWRYVNTSWQYASLFAISCIGLLAFELDLVSESLSRFAYYGEVALPLLYGKTVELERHKIISASLVMALFCASFLYANIYMGYQEIYPYSFQMSALIKDTL